MELTRYEIFPNMITMQDEVSPPFQTNENDWQLMTLHTYNEYQDGRQVLSILSQTENIEAYFQGEDFS